MGSKSKRRKLTVEDRISGLPDAILCHILSFCETKTAVQTCLVSKRWKNLWESVPNLVFDDYDHRAISLLTLVDHVLLLRNSSNIRKFRLRNMSLIHRVDQSHLNRWLRAAIKRNVVELELDLDVWGQLSLSLEVPEGLFKCTTLKCLKITSNLMTNVPTSGCFPRLKSLYVTIVHKIDDSMFKFIPNCTVLEDLTVDGDHLYYIYLKAVSHFGLKTLRFCGMSSYNDCLIDCPKLENLHLKQHWWSFYNMGKIESLTRVSMDLADHVPNEDPDSSGVTEFLEGVSNVTDLSLSAHCFRGGPVPGFRNLRQLRFVCFDCFDWGLLTQFLEKSPILESIVLKREVCDHVESSEDEEREDEEESVNEKGSSEQEEGSPEEEIQDVEESEYEEGSVNGQGSKHHWHPPDCVPTCCTTHLKYVVLRGFRGERCEMEVAKYLLIYGEVLDKMSISFDIETNEKEKKVYRELLKAPRGSRNSIVEFI